MKMTFQSRNFSRTVRTTSQYITLRGFTTCLLIESMTQTPTLAGTLIYTTIIQRNPTISTTTSTLGVSTLVNISRILTIMSEPGPSILTATNITSRTELPQIKRKTKVIRNISRRNPNLRKKPRTKREKAMKLRSRSTRSTRSWKRK